MRTSLAAVAAALMAVMPALADPTCTKFNWPVDRELAILRTARSDTASGTAIAGVPPLGISLKLATGVSLPTPSEKPADPAKFAGYMTLAAPAAGDYLISLSSESWIDVVQGGKPIASTMHSGDPNCPGLRKSVRFTLSDEPVTLEISNAPEDRVLIAVTPWYWPAKP